MRDLLRGMLIPSCSLGVDDVALQNMSNAANSEDPQIRRLGRIDSSEYRRRVVAYFRAVVDEKVAPPPWEGMTWILDLLPHWPRRAINALESYTLAHAQVLPDGRSSALQDCLSIMRAYYIGLPGKLESRRMHLLELDWRQFEALVCLLYRKMGHDARLMPGTKDSGRDVIANREQPGMRSRLQVQCKRWEKNVGISEVQRILGVAAGDKSTSAVLVTSSFFTKPARKIAAEDPRIDLIDGLSLARLFNEYLGDLWPANVSRLAQDGERGAGMDVHF